MKSRYLLGKGLACFYQTWPALPKAIIGFEGGCSGHRCKPILAKTQTHTRQGEEEIERGREREREREREGERESESERVRKGRQKKVKKE